MAASTFYMHLPPIDMSWLRECNGFNAVFENDISKFSEVLAYDVLRQHPARTYNSTNASLFYIPIWEWTSMRIGLCRNTTHRQRMDRVAEELGHTSSYKERAKDHFWITSASQASRFTTNVREEHGDLENRLYGLKRILTPTIVGQRKVQHKRSSSIAVRVFEVPYGTRPPNQRIDRIYFAGSFDVCCTGRQVRCKLAQLYQHPRIQFFNRPRSSKKSICGRNIPTCVQPHCEHDMLKYEYCLVPAGDTSVTARLYSAIAASCIPVVIASIRGSFSEYVDYSKFSIFIDVKEFLRDPEVVVRTIAGLDNNERLARRAHLEMAQQQILWYSNASGTHVLESAMRLRG